MTRPHVFVAHPNGVNCLRCGRVEGSEHLPAERTPCDTCPASADVQMRSADPRVCAGNTAYGSVMANRCTACADGLEETYPDVRWERIPLASAKAVPAGSTT